MQKSVLILEGSPRRNGNSDLLCNAFAQGAESAGHQTEKVYLRQKQINGCLACYGCRSAGICVQKDDMEEMLEKMVQADIIVLATPVYFYSMSGQMKTMIDRTLPRFKEFAGKEFYFIATAAADELAIGRTMDALSGFTDCIPDAKIRGTISAAGVYEKGEVNQTAYIQTAHNMGLHS